MTHDTSQELRRNLHDGVLQILEFMATGGWGVLDCPSQYQRLAARAAQDLRETVEDTALVGDLDSAVRRICSLSVMLSVTGINLVYDIDEQCQKLPAQDVEPLLRAVREAVTNVIQHAKATRIIIRIDIDQNVIRGSVIDDGIGIDLKHYVDQGFGVEHSIYERMRDANGAAAVKQAPHGGTIVELIMPIPSFLHSLQLTITDDHATDNGQVTASPQDG